MQLIGIGMLCAAALVGLTCAQSGAANTPQPWRQIVVGQQSESERLATIDLQRYIAQVTGAVPKIVNAADWQKQPDSTVVLGTPSTNPLLADIQLPKSEVGQQGYYLTNRTIAGAPVIIAAGATPEGSTNAIYGLLREVGFGFYLGSEAIPDQLPDRLPADSVARQPVFAVRGVLPWYNFFNSPTTWDPIDHRAFVDQLIRMGANFVGFHTYDAEPFGAYPENGKMRVGARLLNTASPTWGSNGVAVSEFGSGTDKLYNTKYFGAESTLNIPDADEAIRVEQDIMRDALEYAKRRGLHTCIGFEISGDPLATSDRDVFLKRLNHLLDQYPSAENIWIWQPETQGAQGYAKKYNQHQLGSALQESSLLPRYGIARRDAFHRIVGESAGESPFYQNTEDGRSARANEGARLEQFAQLAHHALSHRKNAPKLVISGWGGDQRLLSAEYYDGLDDLLPKDVAFSSLDHIAPRNRVDSIYNQLPRDRQRWPIPWLENDGDQWHPQPYVRTYEALARDAHKGGSQGILAIHWRTRDVEENFGYLMQYAWDPDLTADAFFVDYAARCYDARIAQNMADIHSALDKLGYRWVGGAGQVECGGFGWGPGEERKAKELEGLRAKAISLLPKAGHGRARLQWLIDEMEWVLRFREAELSAVEAERLLNEASNAEPEKAKQLRKAAIAELYRGDMDRALRAFAERLSTRGEYGVLATINTKAVAAWRNLVQRASKDSSAPAGASTEWSPDPRILLPRFLGSSKAGIPLKLEPVVLGGGRAWLHYRRLGQTKWTTVELQRSEGTWVQSVEIPANAVKAPGMEIAFSFRADPKAAASYGPVAITILPDQKPASPHKLVSVAKNPTLKLNTGEGKVFAVELTWNDIPSADYYRVYCNGQPIIETAVAMFPDSPQGGQAGYYVEAIRDSRVLARSATETVTVRKQTIDEDFSVQVTTSKSGICLTWPAAKSQRISSYRISRCPSGKPEKEKVLGDMDASTAFEHTYWDAAPTGKWVYRVTPLDAAGNPGKLSEACAEFTKQRNPAPVLELAMVAKPQALAAMGDVTFGESGAVFDGGHIIVPHFDSLNLGPAMTLAFEFNAQTAEGMPVLMSHGAYAADGWFIQILNHKLVMRTPGGDVWGPDIQAGKWYSVQFVYDGSLCHLSIDGKKFSSAPLRDVKNSRGLIIGQYESREPSYAFHGSLRYLKMYDQALEDEE